MNSGEWSPQDGLPLNFFNFVEGIYQQDSLGFPESRQEIEAMFKSASGFFKNSGRAWLGVAEGQARLFGSFHPAQVVSGRVSHLASAFFGFWETTDDLVPNLKLFKEFEAWAKGLGAVVVHGPICFSTLGQNRLQLDHFFDVSSFVSEPRNPAYYPKLLGDLGYQLSQKYVSYRAGDPSRLREWGGPLALEMEKQIQGTFRIRLYDENYWVENRTALCLAANQAFSDNFAFSPISQEVFDQVYGAQARSRFCQETSLILEHVSGEIAGFCINYPDYSPLLRRSCGASRKIYNEMSYSMNRRELKRPMLLIKTAGVVPKFRKMGMPFLALVTGVIQKATRYEDVMICLMREGNFPSLLTQDFANETRSYGLFQKLL